MFHDASGFDSVIPISVIAWHVDFGLLDCTEMRVFRVRSYEFATNPGFEIHDRSKTEGDLRANLRIRRIVKEVDHVDDGVLEQRKLGWPTDHI